MAGLRERNKARRRDEILNAAREIVRDEGIAQLTMKRLSEAASLSVATIYNLVGAREDVLMALLRSGVEQLRRDLELARPAEPLEEIRRILELASARLVANPALYRGAVAAGVEFARRGMSEEHVSLTEHLRALIVRALRRGQAGGRVEASLRADLIGLQLLSSFTYCAELWSHRVIDDDALRAFLRHASELILCGVATPEARPACLEQLKAAEQRLKRFRARRR